MRTVKTLIRLGGCPGWSESSLGAYAILLVLSWGGSNSQFMDLFCFLLHRNTPKSSVAQTFAVITLKSERGRLTKDADGMANSADPDQTAPLGTVWSGSTLFAQTCLSENCRSLRYLYLNNFRNKMHTSRCCPVLFLMSPSKKLEHWTYIWCHQKFQKVI